ncbi:MAG: hypothetical protein R3C05_01430 [Pirellulaceae bacterium]
MKFALLSVLSFLTNIAITYCLTDRLQRPQKSPSWSPLQSFF